MYIFVIFLHIKPYTRRQSSAVADITTIIGYLEALKSVGLKR